MTVSSNIVPRTRAWRHSGAKENPLSRGCAFESAQVVGSSPYLLLRRHHSIRRKVQWSRRRPSHHAAGTLQVEERFETQCLDLEVLLWPRRLLESKLNAVSGRPRDRFQVLGYVFGPQDQCAATRQGALADLPVKHVKGNYPMAKCKVTGQCFVKFYPLLP